METTNTTYQITFLLTDHDPSLGDYQNTTYTLDEAIDLATAYGVDIRLSDDHGFRRGLVKGDGSYTLV